MIKNELKLNLNMSYSKLHQTGFHTCTLMRRDLARFEEVGINQTVIDELQAQVDNFAYVKPDELFEQDQMLATQARNELTEEVKTAIRTAMTSVEAAYSNRNIMYISIRNSNLSKISHHEVASRGRVMAELLEKKFDIFQDFGVTADSIENLRTISDQLTLKIDEREVSICLREVATKIRYKTANELLDKVVKYNRIGKRLWQEIDESYANDYVVYEGTNSKPESPPEPDDGEGAEEPNA